MNMKKQIFNIKAWNNKKNVKFVAVGHKELKILYIKKINNMVPILIVVEKGASLTLLIFEVKAQPKRSSHKI